MHRERIRAPLRALKLKPGSFPDENKPEKAADLRGMLKSHNKAIIQSKHWSGADSRAAVETDNQS